MSACPSEEQLARFIEGHATLDERGALQSHLDGCAECRAVVASSVSRGGDPDETAADPALDATLSAGEQDAAAPSLSRGTPVGRYVVLERLGSGGMGTVFAAFDPVLDRRVALKLLRPDLFGKDGQELLQREAKVLARFSHPNVLTVHDTGTFGDRVFLAMELVDGGTLRDWARQRVRSWREIVEMMAAAGDGLAALHRAGFVHRDFKPENVLVGKDGRPRVTDFGLSVRAGAARDRASSGVGTPLYMAPEQMVGAAPDVRGDIFAFAVTLHLLFYGVRPFEGSTLAELRSAIEANRVVEPPRDRRVPARMRALVLRGLRASPDERPASMDEVLAALRSDPQRRRNGILGAAALVTAAIAVGVIGAQVSAKRAASCAAEGALPETVWGAGRRAAIEKAFTASGLGYAAASFQAVANLIDDYARGWSAMRVAACEATRVRHEQPEETLALRTVCLDDRRRELDALVAVLASADRDAVEQATSAASALTPIESCADVRALAQPEPRPREPAARARLEAALARVAEAYALIQIGRPAQGLDQLQPTLAELRAIGHAPSLAYAEYTTAIGKLRVGRPDEGAQHVRESLAMAQQGRDDVRVLTALEGLTQITGQFLGRTDEGLFWSRLAMATLERTGNDPRERTEVIAHRFLVLSSAGRLEEALTDARDVLAAWQKEKGPSHLTTLEAHANLGVVLFNMGRVTEAIAQFQEAVRGFEQTRGVGHPEVVPAKSNLGIATLTLGHLDDAAPIIEAVLTESRAAFGERSAYYAIALSNAGELRSAQGRFEEAAAMQRQAVEILDDLGVGGTVLCEPLTELGLAELRAGHREAAVAPVVRALRLGQESHLPPIELARVQFGAARVLSGLGEAGGPANLPPPHELAMLAKMSWEDAARRYGGENHLHVEEIDAFLRSSMPLIVPPRARKP